MNGISSVTDSPRPGQAHPVVTPEGIAAVEAIMKENRRVTVNELDAHLDMSQSMETTYKSEVIVYLLCSINYEINNNIYGFRNNVDGIAFWSDRE